MLKKRGQASVEFIFLVGVLFFIFILVLGALIFYTKLYNRSSSYVALEDLAFKIKMEIDLAQEVKDGYQRSFTIPSKMGFENYNLSIINKDLTLKMKDYEYSLILPDYVGNITKGTNTIRKENGVVYVNT